MIDVLTLEGTPTERGRRHGEAFADEVAANVDRYLRRFAHYGVDAETALEMAREFVPLVEDGAPAYAAEMRGVAAGSGVPLAKVTLLNARYEVLYGAFAGAAAEDGPGDAPERERPPSPDGCTSFALQGEVTADGRPYMGQNWDWMPDVDVLVTAVRGDDVATHVAFTEAGIVGGKIGVNKHGTSLALNGLVTSADGESPFRLPYHVRFRDVLNADRLSGAVGAVIGSDRACSANVLLGSAAGEFVNLEVLPESATPISPDGGVLTHANHLEAATAADSRFERLLPDTVCRAPRLRRLLERDAGSLSVGDAKAALRDHFDRPASICRHPDPDVPVDERSVTRASAIIDPTERTLAVTDGQPCENDYRTVGLDA